MSVADVFAFIFETQGADDVIDDLKNIEKSEKDVGSASEQLGEKQDNLKKKNLELSKSVAGLIGTYIGFKKVLSEVLGFAKGGEDLHLMAQNAGIGAQELERYGIALQNYGGGLSSATSAISSLNQQMQDIKFGGGGAIKDVAIRYGISLSGKNGLATGEEMLFNIAKRMEGLGKQSQLDLGKKLGLDPAMISLLQGGVANLNKELEKASKFSIYSEEDIENSRKFQMALRELQMSLDKIWGVVARALLPVMTTVTNVISNIFQYLSDHKGFILGLLGSIGVFLGIIAVKSLIATAPFWLMVLAIMAIGTAIGLLVDDFVTFYEGGDSMIGKLAEKFADFFTFLFELRDKLSEIFSEFWNSFVEQFAQAFTKIFEWGEKIKQFFINLWDSIIVGITGIFSSISEKFEKLKSWIPFIGDDDEKETANSGISALNSTQTPLNTMSTNNYGGSSNNNVKIDNVQVVTQATDPTGISKGIGGALSTEFENVLFQNTGGALA